MPDDPIDYHRHRNRAIRGAWSKGVAAGRSERPFASCPYQKPADHPGGSWLDTFKNAWEAGWQEGNNWKQEQLAALRADGLG